MTGFRVKIIDGYGTFHLLPLNTECIITRVIKYNQYRVIYECISDSGIQWSIIRHHFKVISSNKNIREANKNEK